MVDRILIAFILVGAALLLLFRKADTKFLDKVRKGMGVQISTGEQLATDSGQQTSIANPASVYCEQNSGILEIVTDLSGGQFGLCHLSDGTSCEEWAYMRGECGTGK